MRALAAAALLLCIASAHAGRPLETDDALILEPKACQLETWAKRFRESTDVWVLPACNPFGHAELSFGGAMTWEHGESHLTMRQAQVKFAWQPLATDQWGFGGAIGATAFPRREASADKADPYAYLIASRSLFEDALLLHANAGVGRERDFSRNVGIWALGAEVLVAPDVHFLPEVYRPGSGKPYYQLSLRRAFGKGVLVDLSYGNRLSSGSAESWWSIGVHIDTPPFLP